jgi:hypothetical protein
VDALEEWQRRQNGALLRLEDSVKGLYLWIIGILVTTLVTLATLLLTHMMR